MKKIPLILLLLAASYASAGAKEGTYLFRYDLTIRNIPAGTNELKLWLPYPAENDYQRVDDISARGGCSCAKKTENRYGNKILYSSIKSPQDNFFHIQKTYRIKRREFSNKPAESAQGNPAARILPGLELNKYLADDFIIITPYVRQLAAGLVKGKADTIEKARAFYEYVFKNLVYDKTLPGWGSGDIERVCLLKSGNCTDFHSLFVALCRSAGIPAKFVVGVSLPQAGKGTVASYHCWAEFYDSGRGWIPVDISEAWKNKEKQSYYFGAIDEKRVEFTQGRGIVLAPPQEGGALNYFIFPYVEINGERFNDIETTFYYEEA